MGRAVNEADRARSRLHAIAATLSVAMGMPALRRLVALGIVLLFANSALAQTDRVTGEARRFLVYPVASLVDFSERDAGQFGLSYQVRPSKDGTYYFNVNVVRFADEKEAAGACSDLAKWHSGEAYQVRNVGGYACAFVADKRRQDKDSEGKVTVVQLRTTTYVVGPYMGNIAEVSFPPRDGPAPVEPLLAALKGEQQPTDDGGTMAERCPIPQTAETLRKRTAVDTQWVIDFLRSQLAIKSDFERVCFNSAIVRFDAVESVSPAYYDAAQAYTTYGAALKARARWFDEQRGMQRNGDEEKKMLDSLTIAFGTNPGFMSALPPAAVLAMALSGYELVLLAVRDEFVIPAFHEGLYESYRSLRAQHDSVEAFDMATNNRDSAYHMLATRMTPAAGAQKLSGEERSRIVAKFWRTRLEARYQIDAAIDKGPPTAQINAALAPARRCIGGLRQEVAKCVQEAERLTGNK